VELKERQTATVERTIADLRERISDYETYLAQEREKRIRALKTRDPKANSISRFPSNMAMKPSPKMQYMPTVVIESPQQAPSDSRVQYIRPIMNESDSQSGRLDSRDEYTEIAVNESPNPVQLDSRVKYIRTYVNESPNPGQSRQKIRKIYQRGYET
jgi:hypothetical protein